MISCVLMCYLYSGLSDGSTFLVKWHPIFPRILHSSVFLIFNVYFSNIVSALEQQVLLLG